MHILYIMRLICFSYKTNDPWTLEWRHNEHDGVSNQQLHGCSLNCLFRRRSKLHATGPCEGNSPVTGEFSAQRDSSAENVSIWWRQFLRWWLPFFFDTIVKALYTKKQSHQVARNGPCLYESLTRYVNLRVAHEPGMPGTFSLPPTSMETAS